LFCIAFVGVFSAKRHDLQVLCSGFRHATAPGLWLPRAGSVRFCVFLLHLQARHFATASQLRQGGFWVVVDDEY